MNYKIDPFDINDADDFLHDHQIIQYFSEPSSILQKLIKPKNLLLLGGRGSGKSTLLKYISLRAQTDFYKKYGQTTPVLTQENYSGFYFRCYAGIFPLGTTPKDEYQDDELSKIRIMINCAITHQLLQDIQFCIKNGTINITMDENTNLINEIASFLHFKSEEELTLKVYENCFKDVYDKSKRARTKLEDLERDVNFSLDVIDQSHFLYELCDLFADNLIFFSDRYFYILIDEADHLSQIQIKIFNEFVQGSGKHIIFKIASQYYGWNPESLQEAGLEGIDDYMVLKIEEEIFDYTDFLKDLAEKRILLKWGKNVDIYNIFGKGEIKWTKKAIPTGTSIKWSKSGESNALGKPSEVEDNEEDTPREMYNSKYTGTIKYSGFPSLVTLSSGVTRLFIVLCSNILFQAVHSDDWSLEQGIIKRHQQNMVIRSFSKEYFTKIESVPEYGEDIRKLIIIFASKCGLRYWDTEKETSKSIRIELTNYHSDINLNIKKALEKAVSMSYLQKQKIARKPKSYKSNIYNEEYLLNRL